jgi:cyclase
MSGYDLALAHRLREAVSIPITIMGGAGSLDHIGEAIRQLGTIGVAAGSLFVFKGVYRAVLISYPAPDVKEALIHACLPVNHPGHLKIA